MSLEVNKTLVRQFIEEVLNQGNFDKMAQFYVSPELAVHLQADAPMLHRGFPDIHWLIEEMIAEGDKVVVRWTVTGTNTGPFMGRPATGKSARWGGVTINTLKDGKFLEEWVLPDRMVILQQLGIIPASAPIHASDQVAASH